MSKLLANG